MPWKTVGLPMLILAGMVVAGCSKGEMGKVEGEKPGVASKGVLPGSEARPDGAALFKQYCSSCHPDGGNVSDPTRTLHGSVLKKNHITTADDIVRIMRNPISRMIRFDPATLSDQDARAIAEYILSTFK